MSNINHEKYKNALLFFLNNCSGEVGITKLNKLFYYLDFISYRDRGQSVTGETYLSMPRGPFAKNLENTIIKEATVEKLITGEEEPSIYFSRKTRFSSIVEANLSVFDEYEIKLLEHICNEFGDKTARELIARTHLEAPWVYSEENKPLDYKLASDIELFEDLQIA